MCGYYREIFKLHVLLTSLITIALVPSKSWIYVGNFLSFSNSLHPFLDFTLFSMFCFWSHSLILTIFLTAFQNPLFATLKFPNNPTFKFQPFSILKRLVVVTTILYIGKILPTPKISGFPSPTFLTLFSTFLTNFIVAILLVPTLLASCFPQIPFLLPPLNPFLQIIHTHITSPLVLVLHLLNLLSMTINHLFSKSLVLVVSSALFHLKTILEKGVMLWSILLFLPFASICLHLDLLDYYWTVLILDSKNLQSFTYF